MAKKQTHPAPEVHEAEAPAVEKERTEDLAALRERCSTEVIEEAPKGE